MFVRTFQTFVALASWLILTGPTYACPNCKEGLLENGQTGLNLARGFELSIYLMLGAPLFIITVLATVFYFQIKQAKQTGQYPDAAEVIARAEARAHA